MHPAGGCGVLQRLRDIRDGQLAKVFEELGVVEQTLGNWARRERIDRGEREGANTEVREENARIRRELKRLTMERDLIKRSVAFWV